MASIFDRYTSNAKQSTLLELMRNKCESAGGLAIKAGGNADAKTASTIAFCIGGKFYSLAAQATLDLSALAPGTIATGKSAGVFFFVTAAGTVSATLVAEDANGAIACPDFGATKVCFGSVKIANASGSTFTVGTTALDISKVTTTYSDYNLILPGQTI